LSLSVCLITALLFQQLNRQKIALISSYLLLAGFFLVKSGTPVLADDLAASSREKIEILATGFERQSHWHAGQRQFIVPERLSLYDVKLHLQQESSFLIEETSRVSSSGFAVPRIRGQSVALTEVYLEDIHLFDAYSGLPLIAELDLLAFDALEISKGLPPAMLNSISPVGAMRYRLLPLQGGRNSIGFDYGRPFGRSIWGKTQQNISLDGGQQLDLKLFGRLHHSPGEFAFYDHRATPYNEADDRMAKRQQNARRSWQILPIASWSLGPNAFHIITWFQRIGQQQPGLNTLRESQASEKVAFDFAAIAWQRSLSHQSPFLPNQLKVQIHQERQDRQFRDPTNLFLGNASESQMELEQTSVSSALEWQAGPLASYHKLEAQLSQSSVELENNADIDLRMERQRSQVYLGGVWPIFPNLAVTHKWNSLWHDDQFPRQNSRQYQVLGLQKRRQQQAQGIGFGLLWTGFDGLRLYGQYSEYDRPPTILEEFGNGGGVAGNPKLRPETLFHQETGFQWQSYSGRWQWFGAWFRDNLHHKIVFVPRYENAMVASNIARSRVDGFEAGIHWYPNQNWEFIVANTLLQPRDLTNPSLRLMIPGIPERVSIASLGLHIAELSVKFQARHQGAFYRDHLNGRRVPGSTLFNLNGDLSLDRLLGKNEQASSLWELAWQINNLTNIRSLSVANSGSELQQSGRIPLSSYDGAPQPGRNFKISLTHHF